MSIAGEISFQNAIDAGHVRAALARLAYPENNDAQVYIAKLQSASAVVCGTVNGASSADWTGTDSKLLVIFEGELYEPGVLAEQLGVDARGKSFAELAALSFERWGVEFADRLWGEFAFALWDGREQRLLLGRDAMARSPLFYSRVQPGADRWAFASEPRGLQGWPGVDDAMSEEMLARMLSMQPLPGATLWCGIRGVEGGSVLVLQQGREPRTVRYWQPLSKGQWYTRDPREYAEALREAMLRAVEVRLPAQGVVASQLSSGFDSSAVTALAAQVLAKQNRPLLAYTAVPAHQVDAKQILKTRFSNEWPIASQVAAMYPNVEHIAIRNDAADWLESIDVPSDAWAGPAGFIRNSRWYHAIHVSARERGACMVLNGQAGNLVSSYNGGFGLFDLRTRRRWLKLAAAALRRRRVEKTRWKELVHDAWMPQPSTLDRINRLRRRKSADFFSLSLMRPDFYRGTGLPPLGSSPMGATIAGDRTNGTAWRFSILSGADMGMSYAGERRAYGMLRADPTADRRLAELCLSIPDEAFVPAGRKRDLYRIAFRGRLPDALLDEPLRGLQSSDFLEMFGEWIPAWREELNRLEQTPLVARVLDLPRMRTMLQEWPGANPPDKSRADVLYNYTFGGALALGRFLRRGEEQRNRR